MRTMLSAVILAGGIGLTGVPSAVASPIGPGVPSADVVESVIQKTDHRRGRYCERLRRACVYRAWRARRRQLPALSPRVRSLSSRLGVSGKPKTPTDNEFARPKGEHLLVLRTFTAQLGQRVCFGAAGAALGGDAFEFVWASTRS